MLTLKSLFFPHDHKKDHFKALDGLRGIAILIVLFGHASNENIFINKYIDFTSAGRIGVFLFYVLSAYLLDSQIATILINKKATLKYWTNYIIRRFLRIYPLYIIALIVFYNTNSIYLTEIVTVDDIYNHIMLEKGEGIFWSIPVEFKYYFISPIILLIFHYIFKWNKLIVFAVILSIIYYSIYREVNDNLDFDSTLRYLPIFLIGTLISIYEIVNKKLFTKNFFSKYYNHIGIGLVFIVILCMPYYSKVLWNNTSDLQDSKFYLLHGIVWGIVLVSAKYSKGLLSIILESKPLRFIGTISFSLYLFHMPVLRLLLTNTTISESLKIYVFIISSIIIATISYLIIERPLSRIRIKNHSKQHP